MPYDVVGNASGRSTIRDYSDASGGFRHNDGRRRRHYPMSSPTTSCRIFDCARVFFFVFFIGGGVCIFLGVSHLMSSMTDTRGQILRQWHGIVTDWTTTDQATFTSLKPVIQTTVSDSNNNTMSDVTSTITPKSFGESDWSTKKMTTPNKVTDNTWTGLAQCPGNVPNQLCTITISSSPSSSVIATRTITPLQQKGPTTEVVQSNMCQWYDSDYWHPMASIGMGTCNSARVSSQTYNYGPSSCVADHYLDTYGCPNDLIVTSQWVAAGRTWAGNPIVRKHIESQPRFTYDPTSNKCWDYSDCFCTGCGYEFKTDQKKGWGFTGYGYFYNNYWTSFPKPFSQMSNTERAQQCKQQFDNMGYHCPASQVNLVCFRAGGYPKKKCSKWCHEQDSSTAVYTPPKTYVSMMTYYGPWGAYGKYPKYSYQEAQCTYSKTTTTKIVSLDIALDSTSKNALSTGSKWVYKDVFAEQSTIKGTTPFHNIPSTIPVKINIKSSVGPTMEGITLTKGCGPSPPVTSSEGNCFGPTQEQNFVTGLSMTVVGSILFCGPIVCAYLVTKGVIRWFNKDRDTYTNQQQLFYQNPQPYQQYEQQNIPVAPQQYIPPGASIPIAQPFA
jgi:hypothetical protein